MISIIIPCYNAKRFLGETLASLEAQTDQSFEAICIDDGSKDDTLAYLQQYQKNSKLNITVLTQENQGVSKTRNRGIAEAKGSTIAFLDADDTYHPRFIELMGHAMKDNDTVYCRLKRELDQLSDLPGTVSEKDEGSAVYDLLYHMGKYGFYCYLYKKEILDRHGLRFYEDAKYGEDRAFIWNYLVHCRRFAYVDADLYGYRRTPDSAISIASWRRTDTFTCISRVEHYMKDNNYSYLTKYQQYLFPRTFWSVAKSFAVGKRRDLFDRLMEEYDAKAAMYKAFKHTNQQYVRIAALVFLISPSIFYMVMSRMK